MTISEEPIDSSGALSVYYAAVDELDRRYGPSNDDGPRVGLDELKAPRGLFFVARRDGEPIGGVGVRPIGDPRDHLGEVKRLWVRSDARRAGLAAALMHRVEQRSSEVGFTRLYLETGFLQPEAKAFYDKHGWIPVEHYPEGVFSHRHAFRYYKAL